VPAGEVPVRIEHAAFAAAVATCGDTSGAPPAPPPEELPETSIDDEFLAAVVPPEWRVGTRWTLETQTRFYGPRLEPEFANKDFNGLVDFEVVELSDIEATVVATARPFEDSDRPKPERWTMLYGFEPFRLIDRADDDRPLSYPIHPDPSDALAWADATFVHDLVMCGAPPLTAPAWQERNLAFEVLIEQPEVVWKWRSRAPPTFLRLEGFPVLRIIRWLPGDPWWAISEGLDRETKRPFADPYLAGRGRLVAVDGMPIEPMPWTE
jgi:hypothetical protein